MIKRGSDFRPWLGDYEVLVSNHLSPLNASFKAQTHTSLFAPAATHESLLAGYMFRSSSEFLRFGNIRVPFGTRSSTNAHGSWNSVICFLQGLLLMYDNDNDTLLSLTRLHDEQSVMETSGSRDR